MEFVNRSGKCTTKLIKELKFLAMSGAKNPRGDKPNCNMHSFVFINGRALTRDGDDIGRTPTRTIKSAG